MKTDPSGHGLGCPAGEGLLAEGAHQTRLLVQVPPGWGCRGAASSRSWGAACEPLGKKAGEAAGLEVLMGPVSLLPGPVQGSVYSRRSINAATSEGEASHHSTARPIWKPQG